MSNLAKHQTKKEKVQQMLASLTPTSRIAVLEAALEEKQNQKAQKASKAK